MSPLALPDPRVDIGGSLDSGGVQRNFDRLSKLGWAVRRSNADLNVGVTAFVPNCSVTVGEAGVYFVLGIFDFDIAGGAGSAFGVGELAVDGVVQSSAAILSSTDTQDRATISQFWFVTVKAGGSASLTARKVATKTVTLFVTHTGIAMFGPF